MKENFPPFVTVKLMVAPKSSPVDQFKDFLSFLLSRRANTINFSNYFKSTINNGGLEVIRKINCVCSSEFNLLNIGKTCSATVLQWSRGDYCVIPEGCLSTEVPRHCMS